jgi:hypothetical protein
MFTARGLPVVPWSRLCRLGSRHRNGSATVSAMTGSAGGHDDAVTAAQVADLRQAEVFWRELHERLEHLTTRIANHSRRMAHHRNHEEFAEAGLVRRQLREAEREHYAVRRLIGSLDNRFPHLSGRPVPAPQGPRSDFGVLTPHHRHS